MPPNKGKSDQKENKNSETHDNENRNADVKKNQDLRNTKDSDLVIRLNRMRKQDKIFYLFLIIILIVAFVGRYVYNEMMFSKYA